VLFNVPPGWRRTDGNGGAVLAAPGLPDGQNVVIVIAPGQKLDGDFRAAFERLVASANRGMKYQLGPITATRADEGYDALYTTALATDQSGRQQYRFFLACHPRDRLELLMYAAPSKELYQRYEDDLRAFVKAMTFANVIGQPATQP
jgi:hypothetical protein